MHTDDGARLVEVSPDAPPGEVRVPGMPRDAPRAVGKSSIADRSPDRRVQGSEGQKLRLRQYARRVQEALRPTLSGLDLPLILAASEPLASIYRSVNTYPHLADPVIAGNPDAKSDAELAGESRRIFDELYAGELSALRARGAPRGRAGGGPGRGHPALPGVSLTHPGPRPRITAIDREAGSPWPGS